MRLNIWACTVNKTSGLTGEWHAADFGYTTPRHIKVGSCSLLDRTFQKTVVKRHFTWVTSFEAEFCNISLVAGVWLCWFIDWQSGQKKDQQPYASFQGHVVVGTWHLVQWTAGGSLKDNITFTFTTLHLKKVSCETGLGSRAAQQCVWACDVWTHQLCTVLTAAPRAPALWQ